jgi:predicted YcjX-like family ATPase
MMRRRYDAYREVVARPFFRDHFARLDRQIVLVDALASLDTGPDAIRDLQEALVTILDSFRIGQSNLFGALFRPSADRILFAVTKADLVHHSAHDRLEAILKQMAMSAVKRAGSAGAEVDVIALAAVRATREGLVRGDASDLPSIIGTAVAGEVAAGRTFDGRTDVAVFPGDLPDDVSALFDADRDALRALAGAANDLRFVRFRPPALEVEADGIPALPHIRLDRAMQFLFGDRMR